MTGNLSKPILCCDVVEEDASLQLVHADNRDIQDPGIANSGAVYADSGYTCTILDIHQRFRNCNNMAET